MLATNYVASLASDTGHPVEDRRDRRGERRRRRDDRRPAGRRTLRLVTVGTELRPGRWQPLLNPDGTQMLDPTPWVGAVRPFLIESSSQFRTDGPQELSGAAWAEDFNEVKRLGAVNSTARTPEQTHIALFWQSNVPPDLERRRPRPGRRPEPRRRPRRQRPAVRDAQPERRGCRDQLLERQVPLGLLAAMAGDPRGGQGRQPCDRARRIMDGAAHRALSRAPVGASVPRRRTPPRAAELLRHGQHPGRRDERPLPG